MIRAENAADVSAIRAVHESAFPTGVEAELVDRLRERGHLLVSLVAECEGSIIGHVAFSPVTLEPPRPGAAGVGLAPVAVVPSRQRQGIGSELINAGIAACREAGYAFVVVLGDPPYYPRFGFQKASSLGLGNEYGVDDPFMAMELKPGCLSGSTGLVRYGPEFADLQ